MTAPIILLVEDSERTQKTLKTDFSSLGCKVIIAPSSEEAWGNLEKGLKPDVLILDFRLPGESGPKLFRRVTRDPRFKHIPVIPFTSQIAQDILNSTDLVVDFLIERKDLKKEDISYPMITKNGTEDVKDTPSQLILAVGQCLRKLGVELPDKFKDRMITEVRKLA